MTYLKTRMYGQGSSTLTELEALPEGAEERKVFVDVHNPLDKTFEKYGHNFYNVYVKNARGKWTPESGVKYWEQDGDFRKLLPKHVPVYPFEQTDADITDTIESAVKLEDGTNAKFKFVYRNGEKIQYSHNGYSAYWTLLSEDFRNVVKGSYVKDDIVQIGLIIRNGIHTGVSLGADFLTHRLACANGAVGRGANFGSLSIRHIGDPAKMIETFKLGIPIIIKLGSRIIEYYQKATEIKLDERIARHIYKKTGIAGKYYPDYFHIDMDQKELEKRITLTREGRNITLWELFNDLTAPLTHSYNTPDQKENGKRTIHLGISGFSATTRNLHRALINICDNRVNKVEAA